MYLRLGAASAPGGEAPQPGPGGEPIATRPPAEHREPPELLEPAARRGDSEGVGGAAAPAPSASPGAVTDPLPQCMNRSYFSKFTFIPPLYAYFIDIIMASF